jgi:exopolysaccharide biosynthesis polyprenyl glycosylphosphotransferase
VALTLALLEGASLCAAVLIGILAWGHPGLHGWGDVATLLAQALTIAGCCITAFYYNDFYDLRVVKSFTAFAARLLSSFGLAFLLLAALYAVFPQTRIADGPFVSSFFVIIALLLPLRAMSYAFIRSHPFRQRLLVLGRGDLAAGLIREIERRPHLRYTVVGCVDDDHRAGPDARPPHLGPLERLGDIVASVHPDRVIVALSERRGRLPLRALVQARLDGILVEDGVEMYERLTGKLAIESLTPSGIIFSRDFRKSFLDQAVGRALSLVVAIVGLVVMAPLLAVVGLAIRLDSGRPILYVHERVGLHGRRFKLLKFRTMHRGGADAADWTRDQTDRVTRVGKWLRRFRLDELPQFVNILRGDMNLVGPRPHRVAKYEAFLEGIPYFALRSAVRPGLTGWAQVRSGYAARLDEETEKARYDLYYLKHLSLGLDLRILFDTVKIVLFGRGSRAPRRRTAEPRAAMATASPAARSIAQ